LCNLDLHGPSPQSSERLGIEPAARLRLYCVRVQGHPRLPLSLVGRQRTCAPALPPADGRRSTMLVRRGRLQPGQDWASEISKAIRRSRFVLACISNSSISKSGFVQKELRIALDVADEQPEGSTFLIPVRLEECEIPDRLKRWQAADLFKPETYDRLRRALPSKKSTPRPKESMTREFSSWTWYRTGLQRCLCCAKTPPRA
jgi:hypothetical protein